MITLEQTIKEERFHADWYRKLAEVERENYEVSFDRSNANTEIIDYHEQIAKWLEELRELRKEREER